ncbi:hypothetical protein SAY86_027481 [Trapa natans]|uniref:Mitogen-activated protein kinase kinase kinase 1 n=1 Tax=Trapa natans TaxID=22666 RepID=A0AAN7KLH8_TRANT|nr:hypothetical protein SAY86_027481 [Trapa natans]
METIATNSLLQNPRFRVPHPVAGRIVRAIQNRLLLLHRSGPSFFVLGATGNVYSVTLSASPSCTCPDRTAPCKHILFVLIRVLGVPLSDPCLHRKTLRPCHVDRLLVTPSLPGALAGSGLREMFHRHFYQSRQGLTQRPAPIHVEDGAICPVCLDEITAQQGAAEKDSSAAEQKAVVACGTCRNPIHEECLLKWKRSRGRRPAICVICRARWRDKVDQDKYVNLAAYVGQDDKANHAGLRGSSCGD